MLHNDQQDRMQNLAHSASGLTVSRHEGEVVGYPREAIGV